MANLPILKNGKARAVHFSTLAAICEALRYQPGDILEYESNKRLIGIGREINK
jgi:putative transcriptional regulator